MEHYLAKIVAVLLVVTGYVVFCWGVFVSPNSLFFIALSALSLSVFNFAAIFALWVFYLSKQLSTHSVKVLDLKQSVQKKKPVIKSDFEEEDAEKPFKDFAESVTGQMFNRSKEKLTDSLS